MNLSELEQQHAIYGHLIRDDLSQFEQCLANEPVLMSKLSIDGHHLIHIAAASGALSIITFLLNKGDLASIKDDDGHTPLVHATIHGQLEAAQLLVQGGASLIDQGFAKQNAVLIAASVNNRLAILQWAVECLQVQYGKHFDQLFESSLFMATLFASYKGHMDIVVYCFALDSTMINKDENGDSPLFCAACQGHAAITSFLIEQGVDLQKKNHLNETVLEAALKLKQVQTSKIIIAAMLKKNISMPHFSKNSHRLLANELQASMHLRRQPSFWSSDSSSSSSDSSDDLCNYSATSGKQSSLA